MDLRAQAKQQVGASAITAAAAAAAAGETTCCRLYDGDICCRQPSRLCVLMKQTRSLLQPEPGSWVSSCSACGIRWMLVPQCTAFCWHQQHVASVLPVECLRM